MSSLLALLAFSSLILSAALASDLVKRQDFSGLPTCAQTCIVNSLASGTGSCSQTDFACLCKNEAFLKATKSCFGTSCSAADATAATAWSVKTCASIGISVDASSVANTTSGANVTSNTSNTTASSTTAGGGAKSPASTLLIPVLPLPLVTLALLIGSLFV